MYLDSLLPLCISTAKKNDGLILTDLQGYLAQNKPLTTKQAGLAIKILQRNHSALSLVVPNLDDVLETGVWSITPVESKSYPREIRYGGRGLLVVRFAFDRSVVAGIKRLKPSTWVSEDGVWVVKVTRTNFPSVMKFVGQWGFDVDDEVLAFLAGCDSAITEPSTVMLNGDEIVVISRGSEYLDYAMCIERALNV